MDKKQIQNKVLSLFDEELGVEVASVDTDLIETGYLDSLRLVQLLAVMEEEFGITVSTEDLEIENFKTVDRIAEFLERNMAVKQ